MPTERLRVFINPREFLYISNILSLSRIILLPLIVFGLTKNSTGYTIFTITVMTLAIATDGLDGYLARRLNEVSALGKILDPVCDKICIGITAFSVTLLHNFPWWAMGFIILRDIAIVICGILMVEQWTIITSSNIWGKATSFFQASSIIAYALHLPYKTYPLTVAMVFTAVSSISYAMEFYNLKKSIKENVNANAK